MQMLKNRDEEGAEHARVGRGVEIMEGRSERQRERSVIVRGDWEKSLI